MVHADVAAQRRQRRRARRTTAFRVRNRPQRQSPSLAGRVSDARPAFRSHPLRATYRRGSYALILPQDTLGTLDEIVLYQTHHPTPAYTQAGSLEDWQ